MPRELLSRACSNDSAPKEAGGASARAVRVAASFRYLSLLSSSDFAASRSWVNDNSSVAGKHSPSSQRAEACVSYLSFARLPRSLSDGLFSVPARLGCAMGGRLGISADRRFLGSRL